MTIHRSIPLDLIKLTAETQSRASIRDDVIQEYREVWEADPDGNPFPPVVVYFDGTEYWMADGFHRGISAKLAGKHEIDVQVEEGGPRDAVLYGMAANVQHGIRRTNADKRRAVEILFADKAFATKAVRWLAQAACVSTTFVSNVRAELDQSSPGEAVPVSSSDGSKRTRKVKDKKKAEPKAAPEPVDEPATEPVENGFKSVSVLFGKLQREVASIKGPKAVKAHALTLLDVLFECLESWRENRNPSLHAKVKVAFGKLVAWMAQTK